MRPSTSMLLPVIVTTGRYGSNEVLSLSVVVSEASSGVSVTLFADSVTLPACALSSVRACR